MPTPQSDNLTLESALKFLKSYDDSIAKTNVKPSIEPFTEPSGESDQLRKSLLLLKSWSSSINLGICADNSSQGFATLASYLKTLGYQNNLVEENLENLPPSSEPVYLKFNTQKMSHYLDKYTGSYRGVLVACQSDHDLVAGIYGHFPLDIFN